MFLKNARNTISCIIQNKKFQFYPEQVAFINIFDFSKGKVKKLMFGILPDSSSSSSAFSSSSSSSRFVYLEYLQLDL